MLRKQKLALVTIALNAEAHILSKSQLEHIDGIIALLDAVQDYAVAELGVPEKDVFLHASKTKQS